MSKKVNTVPLANYSWRRLVVDAFLEVHPESLKARIVRAERAIARRLHEMPGDLDEQVALRRALKILDGLKPWKNKPVHNWGIADTKEIA